MTSSESCMRTVDSLPAVCRPLTIMTIGGLLALSCFAAGFVFHTYAIKMPYWGWEASRQLGTLFLAVECWLIIRAVRLGFDPVRFFRRLPKSSRQMLVVWLATYSISSIVFAPTHSPYGFMPLLYNLSLLTPLLFAAALSETLTKFDETDLRRLALAIGVAAAAFSVFIAIKFLGRPWLDDGTSDANVWQFAIPGFYSVRLFGAYAGALLAFVLTVLLQQAKTRQVHFAFYISVSVLAGLTLWSGTRNAIVALGIVMPVIVAVFRLVPERGIALNLILSFVVAVIGAWLWLPNDPVFWLIEIGDFDSAEAVTAGRLALWKATWAAYLDHPLFGAAPFANMWALPPDVPVHLQPHNFLLQFLISWGLLAAVAAVSLLAWATICAHRIAWRIPVVVPFLAMLDVLLVMSCFDGILHFARLQMLVMTCYGAIFAMNRHSLEKSTGLEAPQPPV